MGKAIADVLKKYAIHIGVAVLLPLLAEFLPKLADATKLYFTGDPTPTFTEWWNGVKPMFYGLFAAVFYGIIPRKAAK